jgi:hypothetical protein
MKMSRKTLATTSLKNRINQLDREVLEFLTNNGGDIESQQLLVIADLLGILPRRTMPRVKRSGVAGWI